MQRMNMQIQDMPYNFIISIKPNYREMVVHYSTDKGKWKKTPMMCFGLRYYGSIRKKFRQIFFYFEGKTYDGQKFKEGSKKKPFQGMHLSLMPMQQIYLLEKNPDQEFLQDINILSKLDIPVGQMNVNESELRYILEKYPDYLLAHCVWVKDLFQKNRNEECVKMADLAFQILQRQDISLWSHYPQIPKNWIKEILWFGGYASEKANQPEYGIKFLEFGVKILPEDLKIWTTYGDVLLKASLMDRCYSAYLRAIKIAPKDLENYRLLIEAYFVGLEWNSAKKTIAKLNYVLKSTRQTPQDMHRYLVDVQRSHGIIEQNLGNPKEARKFFINGQKIDARNPFNNLAYARFEKSLGNIKKARELANLALQFHPYKDEVAEFIRTL